MFIFLDQNMTNSVCYMNIFYYCINLQQEKIFDISVVTWFIVGGNDLDVEGRKYWEVTKWIEWFDRWKSTQKQESLVWI